MYLILVFHILSTFTHVILFAVTKEMEVPHSNYNSIRDPPENDAENFTMVTVKLDAYASVPSVGQK
jgi:hypothetical protein